jgi:hypothetical protein
MWLIKAKAKVLSSVTTASSMRSDGSLLWILGECSCVATGTYNTTIFMVLSLESTSHACRKKFPRTSSVIRTHYHTCLLKQKSKCVCLRRELKTDQHKSYCDGGEDDKLIIAVGPPLCYLRRRDDVTVHDIVVEERARHGEYR